MSAAADVHSPVRRIAMVGMACRFPGAADIDEFWRNLADGVESLTELEDERLRAAGISESRIADPNHVRLVPMMDDIEGFDAKYFGYNAREAQVADPQQRIFLEVCHTALQHAGYDHQRYPGRVGVYGGGAPNQYGDRYAYNSATARAAVGDLGIEINNASDYVATRVAYALGLTGPAVSVTTACSTALVAVHLACQALAAGDCGMALAGGVNIRTPYYKGHLWAEDSIYSRDGHVRAFDAAGTGTNFGYGAGAVLLKPYDEAVADGDTVYAVIIGSAINNDGAKRASFSAPGTEGQTAVIIQALRSAGGISPDSIGYVEAHGTGTAVGDPIEVAALSAAYREAGGTAVQSIPIGSVKTNIGHLGAAAGVPGLVKTVLAMRHGRLPASLHYETPNPRIAFAETPFHVARHSRPWPKVDGPMRAGVSSFGIGGTNAHIIVEEAGEQLPVDPGRPWQVLPLSAKTETALAVMCDELTAHLACPADPSGAAPTDLADAAHTLQVGRPQLAYRTFAITTHGASPQFGAPTKVNPRTTLSAVFLFPGQGSQYLDMAAELHATEPVFRAAFDECVELAAPLLGADLRDVVLRDRTPDTDAEELTERLRRTEFTQPALFAVEYALAQLWLAWGVEPAAMVGHSIGEIVAACLADVFTLPAAIDFVVTRGRLVQSVPTGAMLALPLTEAEVEPLLTDEISLAAVNGPRATVVAGRHAAIDALREVLERTGVQATVLRTSHAFHSAMLDPVVVPLRDAAVGVGLKPPTRRFVSTVTGEWITDEQATDPEYWAGQARRPVRFAAAVATAATAGAVLLEVGPGRALSSMARQVLGKDVTTVVSLDRPTSGTADDGRGIATALGALWSAGVAVDWSALTGEQRRRRVSLPTYPYEREQFWIDPDPVARAAGTGVPATATATDTDTQDGITYLPVWRQRRLGRSAVAASADGTLLVFTPGDGPVESVARDRSRHGRTVVRVFAGDGFADLGDDCYRIAPADRGDYAELVRALDARGARPTEVLHGWTATAAADDAFGKDAVHAVRDAGFLSLVFLTQALTLRWSDAPLIVRVATTFGADVTGTDTVEPGKALLRGPAKVVPIEFEQVTVQLIDLGGGAGAPELLAELAVPPADATVAYRGSRRWVEDYELASALDHPVAMPHGLRRRGVYLVTGGLGDIGLLVARRLGETAGARLVLTARTALPPPENWDEHLATHGGTDRISRSIRGVRELEAMGSEVMVAAADVTDEPAMRELVEAVRERFGRINGVFHTAGIAGSGLVSMKTREQAEAVLRPKVDGTLVLHRLLGDDIDVFVLFASIFGVTGGYGQLDYCSGNAFQDAYAQARSGSGVQMLSVAWCGWSGVGMLADEVPTGASAPVPAGSAATLVGDPATEPIAPPAPVPPVHGLLGAAETGEAGAAQSVEFRTVVGPDWHWVLTDHRMNDRQVFPGTSYAEMISAAAQQAFGTPAVELRDIIFGKPVPIDGPRTLRVSGTRQDSGAYHFTVTSRSLTSADAQWERHASATAAGHTEQALPDHDVDAIAARCDQRSWTPPLSGPDDVVVFGPHWQVVQEVRLGEGEQLARLELPDDLRADAADYVLHPSLLDGATALSLYLPEVVGSSQSYLPIAYDRILVRAPLPERFYSHVRPRGASTSSGIRSYDIALIDDAGREVVSIEGFSVRIIDVGAVHSGLDTAVAASADAPATSGEPKAQRSAQRLGLADDEILLDPEVGLDLLWRMLDSRLEPHYVVTIETIANKTTRLAGIAAQVAGALEAARSGAFASAATQRVAPATRTVPTSATEDVLLPLWEDAFGVTGLGLDEDFFDLGGNSLVAVQLAVRIRDTFGVNMPGVAVLEYPTVRSLATFVDTARADGVTGPADDVPADLALAAEGSTR